MKQIRKIFLIALSTIVLLSIFSNVKAAGSYSASVGASSLTIGKTTTLTIKTSNAEGRFSITSSNSSVVSVDKSSIWVSSSEGITLTAKGAGSATITIKPESVSDTDLNLITNKKTISITVKDNATDNNTNNHTNNTTKSGDATLKSITIGSKKYSGKSLKDTISYTANADVASIKINAEKNNSKATISGTGTKSLKEGETNKFIITVTAENGTKKNYTLNIIRLAKENNEPNIIDEKANQEEPKQEELKLTSIVIKDVELNTTFSSDVYNYIANVKNMTQLEIDASANLEGAEIKIEGAEELKEGDNKIKVIAILGDKKVEYTIDVYNQITNEETGIIEDNNNIDEDKNKTSFVGSIINIVKDNLVTTVLGAIIALLLILTLSFAIKLHLYSKKIKALMQQTEIKNVEINNNIDENEEPELKEAVKKSKAGKHF